MEEKIPRVSIGLAVYNGERYLEEAIDSILAQTYTDFELIISDNASTDRTEEICRKYAAQDPRIRYYRNKTNIGGANNENRTFELSRGEYFRWAAHDDICAPTLIEKCVEVLDQEPSVVLCYSQIIEIDEHGLQLGLISRNNAASQTSYERFASIASSNDFCEETYGVMRSSVLRSTRLQQNYTASDRTLLCEIALSGVFHEIKAPLFLKRFHPGNVYSDWRARMIWFDPAFEGRIVFPWWLQFFDYLSTIRRVPISRYEKLRCYLYMVKWLLKYGKKMAKDLLVGAYMAMHTQEWRKQKQRDSVTWA